MKFATNPKSECGLVAFDWQIWYNMIWMEKTIGEHDAEPRAVTAYNHLK